MKMQYLKVNAPLYALVWLQLTASAALAKAADGPGTVNFAGSPLQSSDTTVIQGVNTAGSVRVNNIAELERLLNIVTNCLTVGLPILGAYFILRTAYKRKTVPRGKQLRGYLLGLSLILVGLMIPGTINLFVASGCASLFSPAPVFD